MWYIEGKGSHYLWECVKTHFCKYLTKEQVQRLVNADNMWEEARTLGLKDEHCEPCAISRRPHCRLRPASLFSKAGKRPKQLYGASILGGILDTKSRR